MCFDFLLSVSSHLQLPREPEDLLLITVLIIQNRLVLHRWRRSCDVTTAVLSIITRFTVFYYSQPDTEHTVVLLKITGTGNLGALHLMCTLNGAGVESKINQKGDPQTAHLCPYLMHKTRCFQPKLPSSGSWNKWDHLHSSFINVFMDFCSVRLFRCNYIFVFSMVQVGTCSAH